MSEPTGVELKLPTFWKDGDEFQEWIEVIYPGRGEQFRRAYNRAVVEINEQMENLKSV